MEKDSVVDVVAVLKDAGELGEIVGKISQKTVRTIIIYSLIYDYKVID